MFKAGVLGGPRKLFSENYFSILAASRGGTCLSRIVIQSRKNMLHLHYEDSFGINRPCAKCA